MSKFIISMVRPFCTIFGWVSIVAMLCDGIEIPQWFVGMVGGMTAWWFADRSLLHKKRREKGEE